jgi:hypothetical protein
MLHSACITRLSTHSKPVIYNAQLQFLSTLTSVRVTERGRHRSVRRNRRRPLYGTPDQAPASGRRQQSPRNRYELDTPCENVDGSVSSKALTAVFRLLRCYTAYGGLMPTFRDYQSHLQNSNVGIKPPYAA